MQYILKLNANIIKSEPQNNNVDDKYMYNTQLVQKQCQNSSSD